MKLTMGVDPGKTGALAFLDESGRLVHVEDMPQVTGAALGSQVRLLLADLAPVEITVAWVEQVHSMPKQGVRSVWTFAEGYGAVLGALGALGIRVEHATTGKWKPAMRVTADKNTSRQRAIERWPESADLFRRVKDADRAEAALIALYGQGVGA